MYGKDSRMILAESAGSVVSSRGFDRGPEGDPAMSHLALVSTTRALAQPPAAHIAHDLRNRSATIALHVETLDVSPARTPPRRRARRTC